MLGFDFCKKLMEQFSDNPKYPETADGLRVRIQTLQQRASTERHAAAVVERLLERKQFCPTPAEIYEFCEEVPVPERQVKPDTSCPHCGGSGWRHEQRADQTGRLCDFTGRCSCIAQRRAS